MTADDAELVPPPARGGWARRASLLDVEERRLRIERNAERERRQHIETSAIALQSAMRGRASRRKREQLVAARGYTEAAPSPRAAPHVRDLASLRAGEHEW